MNRPGERAVRQESLREHNLALVAREVLTATSAPSRADVAARTGLNRATVSRLVAELVAGRLIVEDEPVAAGAGRPATPLRPAPGTVGGLGLEASIDYLGARALDLAGNTIAEEILPGDYRSSDPHEVLQQLGDLGRSVTARAIEAGAAMTGATLALPGLVTGERLLVAPNLGWQDVDPADHLGMLPGRHRGLDNEARLAALAELSGSDSSSFLFISAGVGIGAAIVVDGEYTAGVHGFAGELGHVCVDPAGPRCRCGASGCLETFAGTAAICQTAGLGSLAQVHEAVVAGDDAALAAVEGAGRALGRALAGMVNLVDVTDVIVGNTLAELLEPMRPAVREELDQRLLAAQWAPVELRAARVQHQPALTGAARAALEPVVADPSSFLADEVIPFDPVTDLQD
ncbi:MAG TPA: ROK family transcriptional regulator [Ruania sp.]|nr:ROK family transcriptional regulator [Ruania sp.]